MCTCAQARSSLPDEIGAVTWVAPNAPHHSTYVPIYAAAADTPSTLNYVTQYKLDRTKSYWAHSVTGNYLSRWFRWTYDDVKAHQVHGLTSGDIWFCNSKVFRKLWRRKSLPSKVRWKARPSKLWRKERTRMLWAICSNFTRILASGEMAVPLIG